MGRKISGVWHYGWRRDLFSTKLAALILDSESMKTYIRSPLSWPGSATRLCLLRVGWLGFFLWVWLALRCALRIRNLAFAGCRGLVRWIPFSFSFFFGVCVSLIMERSTQGQGNCASGTLPCVFVEDWGDGSLYDSGDLTMSGEEQKVQGSISGRRASFAFSFCCVEALRAEGSFGFFQGWEYRTACFCFEGYGEGERLMCV